MLTGTTLALSFWLAVPLGLMAAFFVYSATQEEKYMKQEFGDEYRRYMAKSKMLVPGVIK